MKAKPFLFLFLLLPFVAISQNYKHKKGRTVTLGPSLNLFTEKTGFKLDKNDLVNKFELNAPRNLLSAGFSLRVQPRKGLYHETSLTKLNADKGDFSLYFFFPSNQEFPEPKRAEQIKHFNIGVRYIAGKTVFENAAKGLKCDLGAGFDFDFYQFNYTPKTSFHFPIDGRILSIRLCIAPSISKKIGKNLFLETSAIPYFLIGDVGKFQINNPGLLTRSRKFSPTRQGRNLIMNYALSLRYQLP